MSFETIAARAAQDLRETTSGTTTADLAGLRRTRTRRRGASVAVVGLLAAVVAAGSLLLVRPDPPPPPAGGVRNGALIGSSGGPGLVDGGPLALPADASPSGDLQFSPDGRELFYATDDGRVAAWDVRTEQSRTLADCPRTGCLFSVSPDGGTVALVVGSRFVWVNVATGGRRPYPFSPEGAMSWSPDGTRLAVLSTRGLHVVDLASGESTNVDPAFEGGFWQVAQWSPDGTRLAYVLGRGLGGDIGGRAARYAFSLVVLDADGSHRRVVADLGHCVCMGGEFPAAVTWSPDGTRLAASDPTRSATLSLDPSGGDEKVIGPGATDLAWQPVRR